MEHPPFEDVFPIVKERILKPVMFVLGVLQMDVLEVEKPVLQESTKIKPCSTEKTVK